MTRFYYSQLVKDGLIHCYLCRADGDYVGFVAATDRPLSFMREGMRRHPVRLAAVLTQCLCQKPSRARVLVATAADSRRRTSAEDGADLGEILSIGVLETARRPGDASGPRPSRALLDAAVGFLAERGCRQVEVNVEEDNARAIRFYESRGFVLRRSPLGHPNELRGRLVLQPIQVAHPRDRRMGDPAP
jgi:ribosomal protein S18 acetylase RimI-like enzyme